MPRPRRPASPSAAAAEYVLFLDDERSYVELMTELLKEHLTCSIISHTKPLEALADLTNKQVGVIVTDYYMPSMNGFEFIQKAHALVPNAAIILVSGHTLDVPDEQLLRIPGLKAIMHKPLSWRALADNIIRYWPGTNPPVAKIHR